MRNLPLSAVLVALVGCAPEVPREPSGGAGLPGTGSTQVATRQRQALMAFRPVVGGHLAPADQGLVAVADAENDRFLLFDPVNERTVLQVTFDAGAWPTRVQLHERVYDVLLRGSGTLARIEGTTVKWNVDVCAEPRSLTWDGAHREALVGCAGGEVVRVDDTGKARVEQTGVEWRDLVVRKDGVLFGSAFRQAQVVTVTEAGPVVTGEPTPMPGVSTTGGLSRPQVAWKMISTARGEVWLVHQLHADDLGTMPGEATTGTPAYGTVGPPTAPPTGAVVTGVTHFDVDGAVLSTSLTHDVLPVDAALSSDGTMLAVVGAGGTGLSVYDTASFSRGGLAFPVMTARGLPLTSVTWTSPTELFVLESLRATPMRFDLRSATLSRPTMQPFAGSVAHALFHEAPAGGSALSCASCHPEGGDDGHTWVMNGAPRRTQPLGGKVMNRAPFHWKGDVPDLAKVMSVTFVQRMGGAEVDAETVRTLGTWMNGIPAPRASVVLTDAERTAGLKAYAAAGCGSCHRDSEKGARANVSGELLLTPPLQGLGARGPWLHDGSVTDLDGAVMGATLGHGALKGLDLTDRAALVRYLRSM